MFTPALFEEVVWDGIDAHIVLGWWHSALFRLPQFFALGNVGPPRYLAPRAARAGLTATAQQELLQRLAWAIDRRTRYFPDPSLAYVERTKELLLLAFLPHKGPLAIADSTDEASETLSRSRAWELAYLELAMWDGARRPLHDLHMVLVDVICMLARNDFPLTIPPRWLGELF